MGKRIIISEDEKKDILVKYQLNEDFQSDDGLVVAGGNKYQMFKDGDKLIYKGKEGNGYKMCKDMGWPLGVQCQVVGSEVLDPKKVSELEQQMVQGVNPVKYTTPKGANIEFQKV